MKVAPLIKKYSDATHKEAQTMPAKFAVEQLESLRATAKYHEVFLLGFGLLETIELR